MEANFISEIFGSEGKFSRINGTKIFFTLQFKKKKKLI